MKSILPVVAISVVLQACGPQAASSQLASSETEAEMLELPNPRCSIRYAPTVEADARKFDRWISDAAAAMTTEFSAHEPETILSLVKSCAVLVYDQPNSFAAEGMALVESLVDPSTHEITARIHFLAPSKHGPDAMTSVLEPMDDNYIYKTLVHEYGTLFLASITDRKSGWRFFHDAFGWFEQGYEEYLGVMFSSEHSRSVTRKKYLELALRDSPQIDFDFGLNVGNDYTDGVVLMMFMHDVYGKDQVQQILASPEPTFAKALLKTVGSLDAFRGKFEAWREQTLSSL